MPVQGFTMVEFQHRFDHDHHILDRKRERNVAIRRLLLRALIGLSALIACAGVCGPVLFSSAQAAPEHGVAMYGSPDLPAGFAHLPYARPDVPKGGRMVLGAQGTFDGLNPFILRGSTAPLGITAYLVQSLMARSADEPFSLYGLIAESIDTPPDRGSVTFRLNPKARFSDKKPITAEDVRFSWDLLRTKGRPNHRSYYNRVAAADILDPLTIRFTFKQPADYELPLIMGLMPVLPKHAINPETFERVSLEPLLGSGPYIIQDVKPGSSITYRRDPDYWAKDLPVTRGLYNADEIQIEYFRDANALFEAFKAGLYDIRVENDPTRWLTGYDIAGVRDGAIIKEAFRLETPKPMFGFAFNTRRPLFADVRVREALGLMFDFEWQNRNLFGGVYSRTASFFEDSELSSRGRSADAREKALLEPFGPLIRPEIIAGTWEPLASDGTGRDRAGVRKALDLLEAAGFELRDGQLRRRSNGAPFIIEILVDGKENERLSLSYAGALKRVGIELRVRLIDSQQYQKRLLDFDFDLILNTWIASTSPGNEQRNRWSSVAADARGSFNYPGVKSRAVDAMLDAVVESRTKADFVSAVRALDRALLSGFYVVPLFYLKERWVARSARLGRPERIPRFEVVNDVWWLRRPE
jgi:peptide/nickel transport system substrate-binding protein